MPRVGGFWELCSSCAGSPGARAIEGWVVPGGGCVGIVVERVPESVIAASFCDGLGSLISDAIERTRRLTGVPRYEIVRRGLQVR